MYSRRFYSLRELCYKSDLHDFQEEDKDRIKIIKTFDDELSRVFFAEKCVVVEGDTEVIAIKKSLELLDEENRRRIQSKYQIVKARGKATIIPLARYLALLNIPFDILHDRDFGTDKAYQLNSNIEEAVGDFGNIYMLVNCIEDCFGYKPPSSEKPLKMYGKLRDIKK